MQGCVKVWDIGQSSGKNPISTLECLVSQHFEQEILKNLQVAELLPWADSLIFNPIYVSLPYFTER